MGRLALPTALVAALVGAGVAAVALDLPARERAPDRPSATNLSRPGPNALPPRRLKPRPAPRRIEWRDSKALGTPAEGSLRGGVKVPARGRHHFTWDPVQRVSPSPSWRRWGTDDLVRVLMRVIRDYARAHPGAPRVGIGDLSLPRGGDFGPEVSGGIGHHTHQNGLDADIYYPLRSGAERAPLRVSEIRLRLAQDLVDRFVAAGAELIYVGPSTSLTGPPGVVVAAANHDNHLHVRIPNPG